MAQENCINPRCCRGYKHPQESDPRNIFRCRDCNDEITKKNLGENGGCRLCGPCSMKLGRCGHCGRPFGTI